MSDSTPTSPPTTRRSPIRRLFAWIGSRPAALWSRIQPAPRTRRAVSIAGVAMALALGGYLGDQIRSGEGRHWDILFGVGVALLIVLLTPLLWKLLGATLRFVPSAIGWFGTSALVAILALLGTGLPDSFALALGGVAFLAAALLFGSVATITAGNFRQRGVFARSFTLLSGIAGLGGAVALGIWLSDRGTVDHLVVTPTLAAEHRPPTLQAPDPSANGPHRVATLTYGCGTDKRRPEFGEDADIQTETVNGKPFASMPSGLFGTMRERYWGFDVTRLPLNGRVWYPDGDGSFPLVLCVHGNHHMADYSDPGYAYLGELLASRGIVFVSVDQNFVNGSAVAGGLRKENDLRAWLLLKHLEQWREWNGTEGSPFFAKIDFDNIGLVGHSRGGEAVCHATLFNRLSRYPDDATVEFDFEFAIKAVISIAPCDGQYRPAGRDTVMRDVSYFTIHGGHDADVSSFRGDRHYRRLEITEGSDHFKASLYVYRANHGQFNQVWGDTDTSALGGFFLNRDTLLTGEEQRRIARIWFGAFFAATLQGQRAYVDLFRNHHRAHGWAPETLIVSRYEDSSFRNLSDFEEDVDVTTTSIRGGSIRSAGLVVWREGDIPLRGGSRRDDNGVFLGWTNENEPDEDPSPGESEVAAEDPAQETATPAHFAITLPDDFALDGSDTLVFSLGEAKEKAKAKDYSVTSEQPQPPDGDGPEPDSQDDVATNETDNSGEQTAEEDSTDSEDDDRPPLDLTVELIGRDGTSSRLPLSRFGVIAPPLKVQITRHDWLEQRYRSAYEPVLQTYHIPLRAFVDAEPGFQPGQLAEVRLVFDRAPKGVVIVDRIGLAAGGQ